MDRAKTSRIIRGYAILAKGCEPKQLDEATFRVPSQSGNGSYLVAFIDGEWRCECPDHQYRRVVCKHIYAVKFWVALREKIASEGVFRLEEVTEKPRCPYCGSPKAVKNGRRKTKHGFRQRFLCRECGRTFIIDEAFKKIIGDPRIVSLSLDLYFKGLSLRKVEDHLKQFYGVKVTHVTIYNWIKRYVKLINTYVEKLEPNLSAIWHADEMKVKAGGKWVWLWNVMDEETRFLLCSMVSRKREIKDARRVFQRAKRTAKAKPEAVVTDGLPAYIKAFKKEFFTLRKPRVKHIRMPRFTDRVNNNLVERLHGTIRERDKVMRGMNGEDTAQLLLEGLRIYYNFIRPHQSLNGKTPAEEAGIDLNLESNKWLSLIKRSVNKG